MNNTHLQRWSALECPLENPALQTPCALVKTAVPVRDFADLLPGHLGTSLMPYCCTVYLSFVECGVVSFIHIPVVHLTYF